MFPISLNLATIPVLLIGEGEAFEKRKAQLVEMGATHLISLPIRGRVGVGASTEQPSENAPLLTSPLMGEVSVVMVAGLDHSASEIIAREARAAKKLVNVEDVPELCDFYFTSFVQRGELTIAVSTNGASPTLAKRVREKISEIFGEEWSEHLAQVKQLRLRLRGEGKTMKEVMAASEKFMDEQGWAA